jgi:murein DD-endopeptidase / murein LD-carboxypeptidase
MKNYIMLLKTIILILCLFVFIDCYSSNQENNFDINSYTQDSDRSNKRALNEFKKIMATITDPQTRKKLKNFVKNGFEKPINLSSNVTPDDLIDTAKKYIGVKHKFGGDSKNGMDCSGLIKLTLSKYNIKLPHGSEEQARYGSVIAERNKLKKGDLIFFIDTYTTPKLITHVGLYLGNNEMIHTSTKRGVSISPTDNTYWKPRYLFGTRIFNRIEGYELTLETDTEKKRIDEDLFVLNSTKVEEENIKKEIEGEKAPEYNEIENEENQNTINSNVTKEFVIEGSSEKEEEEDKEENKESNPQKENNSLLEKHKNLLTIAKDSDTRKKLEEFIKSGIEKEFSLDKIGVDKFVSTSFKYKGVKYKSGGTSNTGLDASGLIVATLRYYEIEIPHSSQEIARYGKIITKRKDMKKGDLIFFTKTYNTPNLVSHMGIYLGNDQMIHTSSSRGVTISSVNSSYWKPKFIFGTRVFNSNE